MIEIAFDPLRYPEEAAALRLLEVPASVCVIGIDLTAPAEGVARIIAARRAGETVALLPILPDPF